MELMYTTGETMKEAFFKPIDNLWGLYGIRARLATVSKGRYCKKNLFLDVSFNEGAKWEPDLLPHANRIDLSQPDSLGWAFTIEKIIDPIQADVQDEKEVGGFVTGFRVIISLVTTTNRCELESRPVSANQISPSLFVPKAIILEAANAQRDDSAKYGDQMVLRIGRYDDGRYVLFLHGSNNETNYPIRIPHDQ